MSDFYNDIARDCNEILANLGRDIEFRDKKLKALLDNNPVEEVLSDGGFVYKAGYRVRLVADIQSKFISDPPNQGEIMVIYGREHTITKVSQRQPSPWLDVFVIATNQ